MSSSAAGARGQGGVAAQATLMTATHTTQLQAYTHAEVTQPSGCRHSPTQHHIYSFTRWWSKPPIPARRRAEDTEQLILAATWISMAASAAPGRGAPAAVASAEALVPRRPARWWPRPCCTPTSVSSRWWRGAPGSPARQLRRRGLPAPLPSHREHHGGVRPRSVARHRDRGGRRRPGDAGGPGPAAPQRRRLPARARRARPDRGHRRCRRGRRRRDREPGAARNAHVSDWRTAVAQLETMRARWPDALDAMVGLRVPPDRFAEAFAFRGVKATMVFD